MGMRQIYEYEMISGISKANHFYGKNLITLSVHDFYASILTVQVLIFVTIGCRSDFEL